MTDLPETFFKARRIDGMAVRAAVTKAGGLEVLAWNGSAWAAEPGICFAEFSCAIPASAAFLDRIGVPADDAARWPVPAASLERDDR